MPDGTEVDDVFSVADGRTRQDIETRADLLFAHLNRARADSASVGDRGLLLLRAAAWVHVLRYMDRTGADVFSAADCEADGGGFRNLASTFGEVTTLKLLHTRKPFNFAAFALRETAR